MFCGGRLVRTSGRRACFFLGKIDDKKRKFRDIIKKNPRIYADTNKESITETAGTSE